MRVHTKVVWQWVGNDLVQVEDEFFEYEGPVDLCGGGSGGGGNNNYYANLENLYGLQEESGRELLGMAREQVFPRYKRMGDEYDYMGSIADQEKQAQRAAADVMSGYSASTQAAQDNLASMGINPSDERYQRMMQAGAVQNAGQLAAAMTGARDTAVKEGQGKREWLTSLGMGMPSQANQALGAASSSMNAYGAMQNANRQANASSYAGAVQGGMALYNMFNGADGGIVRLNGGGYVQKMAQGGFLAQPMVSPPPTGMASPRQQGLGPMSAAPAASLPKFTSNVGSGVGKVGDMFGNTSTSNFGRGMANPEVGMRNAEFLRAEAQRQVDAHIGTEAAINTPGGGVPTSAHWQAPAEWVSAEGGAGYAAPAEWASAEGGTGYELAAEATPYMSAAEADTALASATANAGEAAAEAVPLLEAAGGLEAGAALGTAVPVLGAGLAAYGIGNSLGWWRDGGEVTPYSHGAAGGKVDGPGGPKSDDVPAMLSDGEFVMPVGAVKFFGLDKLEKMRQKGLEYEKQLGITR